MRLLDYWHAVQHLWAPSAARFGDGDRRIPAWVGMAKARLARGEAAALLAGWDRASPEDAATFTVELTYFRNQAPKPDYATARAAGVPIGSGAVESANRHVSASALSRPACAGPRPACAASWPCAPSSAAGSGSDFVMRAARLR